MTPITPTHRWISNRVRNICIVVFVVGSFLPPYVPKAALAPQDVAIASQQFLLVEDGFIKKTSPLTSQGARRAYAKGTIHIVKDGDSLERLSRWYPVSVDTIRWANDIQPGNSIRPGDELLILPVEGILHSVSRGQTLSRIAQLYDIPQTEIMQQNDLKSEFIIAGQQLIIPGGAPIVQKSVQVATVDDKPTEQDAPTDKPADKPTEVAQKPTGAFTPTPTAGVLQKPCAADCFYTQYYHGRHFAVDMQDRGGGPVYAAEAGTVIRSDMGWNGGYGNVVEVDHGNGLVTLYAHNKELYVEVGDHVARGQTITWMGNSGLVYGATGIHVHFEVRLNGVKKNPILY
ncbi:MAG: peptidoglycan DD-metalloendopeptidase family protein, partial [Candidatus Peribacteraceae bacterium]|nr:peptidoglycan DD-metalloendopeptidase family protein [Candidatus Peribacteraceae bacterium]